MDTGPERILKLPEVVDTTKLSRTTIYTLVQNGEFPRPLRLSARASGWLLSEVQGWLSRKAAIRNEP
ncbi:MAG: helix-turn-helix transcriptional regulator [Leptospirales bacterium]